MRISRARIEETVDVMSDEWSEFIRENGQLTPDFMIKSIRRASYHGKDVALIQSERSLQIADEIFTGER